MNEQNKANTIALSISYLLVVAVAFRGVVWFPDVRNQVLLLLSLLSIAFAGERLLPASRIGWRSFTIGIHLIIMVFLFVVAPGSDFWALMMLPACIIVMQMYDERAGWISIGVFSLVMGVMQIQSEGVIDGLVNTAVYLAAFGFVGLCSLLLKRTQYQKAHSDELLQQLKETHRKLGEYASRVELLTSVRERNRIARDLRDSVTQTIFSMTLLTRSARMMFQNDPNSIPGELEQIEDLARGALEEMRSLIHELRPPADSEVDLKSAVASHVEEFTSTTDLDIDLDFPHHTLDLVAEVRSEVFGVIQEALNNVAKHSRATEAKINAYDAGDEIRVLVEDNGVGFAPGEINPEPGHLGLTSMRERAAEIGGELSIESRIDAGTSVKLTIPKESR